MLRESLGVRRSAVQREIPDAARTGELAPRTSVRTTLCLVSNHVA